jgi:hypothetical protein
MRECAHARVPVPQADVRHPLEEWFADARLLRQSRYASYDPAKATRKRRAALTMVHNEAVFFPIWLRYYSRFFAPTDIHVLDNETTDGSTDGDGFVRVPVSHGMVDMTWMLQTVEAYQHLLMDRYDAVLVTDVDEIVAPDPEWGTLGEYIDRFDEPWVNCLGYEILHLKHVEPPYRPDRPVLDQRGYWFANDGYDKPALATEPMTWKPGFHHRADDDFSLDPDLRLIHLHRMDYDICRERHRLREERAWNQLDLDQGWAVHNRLTSGREFDRWFYEDSSFSRIPIVLERIPASWSGLF